MFDVITIGGATRDVFFDTSEGRILEDKESESGKVLAFEYGAKIIPEKVSFCYGGGGLNTAVSFARLGLKVATLINIGKEGTGSLIFKEAEKENIDTTLISRDESAHTAMSVIISKNKDHAMFLYRDANNNLSVRDWGELKETGWIYLASLTGKSQEILEDLPDFLKKNEIKLAWNPGSEQIVKGIDKLSEVLKNTEILILNKAEAKELLNLEAEESELLQKLKELGPKIVVITDGNNGSYVLSDQEYTEKSHADLVEETTGAGDAYGSTFVASQIKGLGIKDSMKLASRNAASVISKVGAHQGLLKKEELF